MKLRAALGILAIAVTITACGSSSPPSGETGSGGATVASYAGSPAGSATPPSGDATSPTGDASTQDASPAGGGGGSVFCTNLITAEQRLSGIEQSVSGGDLDQAKKAIDAEIGTFRQLSSSAPGEVKPALQDIVEILTTAKRALTNPTSPDVAGIQDLGTKLPGDLNALGNYVANNCQGV